MLKMLIHLVDTGIIPIFVALKNEYTYIGKKKSRLKPTL